MSKNRKKGMRTMSKLFMYGTSLEGIEQLMVMVPNFQPRRSGIVINNYFNCRVGAKDCNCNVINVSKGLDKCGYISSDFKVNVDKKRYKDLVMETLGRFYNYLQNQNLDINSLPYTKLKKQFQLKKRYMNSIISDTIDTIYCVLTVIVIE